MDNSDENLNNSDENLNNSDENLNTNEGEMEQDVPSIPLYTMAPGCSATLAGNAPIDYFSHFVDELMLQHIVEQTILNSKHMDSLLAFGPWPWCWLWKATIPEIIPGHHWVHHLFFRACIDCFTDSVAL